jgi:hypothetical protein
MNRWDCPKLKIFYIAEETVTRVKKLPTECEEIFSRYTFDKELISRLYRVLKKLNNPMKKLAQFLQRKRYKYPMNT